MTLDHELLDVTSMPLEDVADYMESDPIGLPNSMRAIAVTKACALAIDGMVYELDPGDVLIDAPQKMQRMACAGNLFEFLFGCRA